MERDIISMILFGIAMIISFIYLGIQLSEKQILMLVLMMMAVASFMRLSNVDGGKRK